MKKNREELQLELSMLVKDSKTKKRLYLKAERKLKDHQEEMNRVGRQTTLSDFDTAEIDCTYEEKRE